MATAAQVTLRHRRALNLAATAVVGDVARRCQSADPDDIDGWWDSVAAGAIRVVAGGFRSTSVLASRYLVAHAATAEVELEPVAAVVDLAQLATSLRVVGPVGFKTQFRRSGSTDAALRVMRARTAGTTRRLVLAGARETTMATIQTAPAITGYQRVTAAGACKFCEMLAGRGAVYKTSGRAGTASGLRGTQPAGRAFHDSCACTVEPVYS